MIVSLLVAMDKTRGIGHHNRIPWRLPADLVHFKAVTMGHHLIMGRKTFESIGRVLPGRTMIVLTRQAEYASRLPQGCLVAHTLEDALALARTRGETEVFVIGGGAIFQQALPLADRIYLTQVDAAVEADTFFPQLNQDEWQVQKLIEREADQENQYPFTIYLLVRSKNRAETQ